MRHAAPLPAVSPLPLPHARLQHRRHHIGDFALDAEAIEQFNLQLHELNPDAPHIDADAVASVARWLSAQPADEAASLLQARLGRTPELRAMMVDGDWSMEPTTRRAIEHLLDYIEESEDLIPDRMPLVGRLDDALMMELAWPAIADELDDYRDFCQFRIESRGVYRGHPSREDWLLTRTQEGALWEHMHRVRERYYVDPGPSDDVLRVI